MRAAKPRLALIEGGRVAEKCPPPAWLSAFAAEEWRRVVPFLQRRKALHRENTQAVESYCVAAGMVRECEVLMQRDGRVVRVKDGLRTHPAFKMQAAAMREARLLAAELGLTGPRGAPGGKGKVDEPEGEDDGFDADLLA